MNDDARITNPGSSKNAAVEHHTADHAGGHTTAAAQTTNSAHTSNTTHTANTTHITNTAHTAHGAGAPDWNPPAVMEQLRAFGYLCPACGKAVLGVRDAFTLAASDANLVCSCGKSALHTEYDGRQWHITVPCGLCGDTHTAVCPPKRMLRGATALACSRTGQFSCFIGPEETVEQHLADLERLADRQEQGEPFLDSVVMYEILSELKDIASRPDGIVCRCGSRKYGMEIRRAAVDLVCRSCGGKLRLPAASQRDLDDLCCHMALEIPGGAE